MKTFEIHFTLQDHQYTAEVVSIQAKDHVQYTISPCEEDMLLKYKTQVVHQFEGRVMEAAFPGTTEDEKAYAAAVTRGLKNHLRQQ